jgi:GrpB-like predicted nucleotidyltransferase (UPF0157 family)
MVATMPAPSPDRILIADYNPAWPLLFEDERQRLQPAIGEWAVAIESTHEQFAGHIELRDYLRAHPDAAGEYEQLKRLLARENANIDDYAAARSDFVRDVLARARGSRSNA